MWQGFENAVVFFGHMFWQNFEHLLINESARHNMTVVYFLKMFHILDPKSKHLLNLTKTKLLPNIYTLSAAPQVVRQLQL